MTLSCVLCLLCAETLFDGLLEAYLPLGLDSMLLSPLPRCNSLVSLQTVTAQQLQYLLQCLRNFPHQICHQICRQLSNTQTDVQGRGWQACN